ncbi:hypothetical protein RND71_031312 [Anisodus tanguticus]|uniref:Uncharacterized protein n=1 Tax=Anisodus tanguticus TaxID=243964 RepID=A0AAE1RDD5_9SOLA|nr:hypothetical protein RND71_031312 [Anisodus tanguticus]
MSKSYKWIYIECRRQNLKNASTNTHNSQHEKQVYNSPYRKNVKLRFERSYTQCFAEINTTGVFLSSFSPKLSSIRVVERRRKMLGDGAQTPSRSELLCMVKKNSNMLGKTVVEAEEASDVETDARFWHDVMDVYFIRGRESRGRQEDDLVFFVKKLHLQKHGSNEDESANSPYFVRRWAPKVKAAQVFNSDFSDTHIEVVKTVYASPSRINFHLDSRKEVEQTSAYPEICFAVDDFDSTFDAVVLTDVDHCYCVLLNAHDGAAFPRERIQQDCCPTDTSRSDTTGRSGFGSLLSLHSVGKTDRIYMKGPGGRGEVEVAVSGVVDQSKQDFSQNSVDHDSKKGLGFSAVVRRAASVASEAAKHAYAAASATRDEGMIPLKCCLMSISLPWEHIAHDLLFKGKKISAGDFNGNWVCIKIA